MKTKGLDKLIYGLERFKKNLDGRVTRKLLEKVKEFGVDYAKRNVANIATGETEDSIHGEIEGNSVIIEAGGQAVWLEFGTGITYNPNPYPAELPDGIVEHGTYGKGKGSNKNGWYYTTDGTWGATTGRDQKLYDAEIGELTYSGTYIAHTYGIEANMFMWKTITAIEEKAPEWGLELISIELKAI